MRDPQQLQKAIADVERMIQQNFTMQTDNVCEFLDRVSDDADMLKDAQWLRDRRDEMFLVKETLSWVLQEEDADPFWNLNASLDWKTVRTYSGTMKGE